MKIIVIGAGLAGAATAYALAQRGCEVLVLEGCAAQDNSSPSASLPVALMAAHHSKQDIPISQLSRLGLAATTRFAQTHLQEGQDWQRCGALLRTGRFSPVAQWFADAAWIKPAALLNVWLAHPKIELHYGVAVHQLRWMQTPASAWQALDAVGHVLAQADAAVIATAFAARSMLASVIDAQAQTIPLPDLNVQSVAGQVLMGAWNERWQSGWSEFLPELSALRASSEMPTPMQTPRPTHYCAINGNGHFLPAVPIAQGQPMWLSGSTYEHDASCPLVTPQGQQANLERLHSLIPAAASLLAEQQRDGQLSGWAGSRCTTHDRLPVVGAVSPQHAPGLYICTALGSRGASFSSVCAEHIASLILQTQDSPLHASLAQTLAMRHIN